MRRLIRATDRTCVFVGCRAPATDCDIDQHDPWAENGPTDVENLGPMCDHDHDLKTIGGWTHKRINGAHHWTSPLGHTYITSGQSP